MTPHPFRLIDTHAHLDAIQNLQEILARAQQGGIEAIVAVGSDRASNERILELAHQFPGYVLPSIGFHPSRLEGDLEPNFSLIEKEIGRCLALGEIGLDFATAVSRELQMETLQRLLAIARQEEKPVLIHARRAWGEALHLLKNFHIQKAVFHWYSGPSEVLGCLIDQGYFISATPAAAYSEPHRRAVQQVPLNRLLLETDAPESYCGTISEPRDLWKTLQAVNALRPETEDEISLQTYRNTVEFFSLDPNPIGKRGK
jgi:TatD DNase family protein